MRRRFSLSWMRSKAIVPPIRTRFFYARLVTPVTLDDGSVVDAWAYLYNAPLGRAERIASGDYLEYLKAR